MPECKYHVDHENRIKGAEIDVKENHKLIMENRGILSTFSPKLWIAVISLVTGVLSTCGAILGIVLVAYFKSKGMM